MSDMYGAVRSNTFKVKNVQKFKKWFEKNVSFGDETQVWGDSKTITFGGYEQYPSAYPKHPYDGSDNELDWGLEEFAKEVRKHLIKGEEFRVFSAGHEKLRYVEACHLIITATSATFTSYGEG